ncbi:MAG: aminotransferase class III-fold pyridoxal phosphate-dependent enzyme [Pseudomonadales bacterium]|nr:aminotransferase class III-fold pyridoxal phosphate-dependent enzyme [Pseudomonadales bacterium]
MNDEDLLARRYRLLGKHSPLFYDNPLHLVRGEGVWLYDTDGKCYLDAYNNVPVVGHCNPQVVEALTRQAATLNIHTRYLHENIVNYAERLTATFDDSLSMAMFACTGSEANELALRIARHCTGGMGIIVTDFAYHGNTAAVAELGTGFMPEAINAINVRAFPIPDSYRGLNSLQGAELAEAYANEVQKAIDSFTEAGIKLAGILVCPEFANEGLLKTPPGFIELAVERVRKAGGLYIADEVQGGFGRTGTHLWSHQWDKVTPDIVTLGKPMGNGHPMSAVIARAELIDHFGRSSMYFNTFGGNPVSCAVGMAVLDEIEQNNLLAQVTEVGAYVATGLRRLGEKYELIGEVRDRGLFFGLELVCDRQSKEPAVTETKRLVNRMRDRGVLLSKIGRFDNILKIRPPLVFTHQHADLLLTTLDEALASL